MNLTKKQMDIYRFIVSFEKDHGHTPTRREICRHFGFASDNSAQCHMRYLKNKGVIDIVPGSARCITVILQPEQMEIRERRSAATDDEYLSPWSMRLAGFVSRVQITEQAVLAAIHRSRKLAPVTERKDY